MKEIILITIIGMLSLVSAISISPDRLDLNLSVGESYTTQFEINSNMDSNVSVLSLNKNCLMEETFLVNSGINYKNLTIYIPFDASPTEQDCEFEIRFIDIPSIQVSSGGGGGHSHKVVVPIINATNQTNQSQYGVDMHTDISEDVGVIPTADTNQTIIPIQEKENPIKHFFSSIWEWFKGLFKW